MGIYMPLSKNALEASVERGTRRMVEASEETERVSERAELVRKWDVSAAGGGSGL